MRTLVPRASLNVAGLLVFATPFLQASRPEISNDLLPGMLLAVVLAGVLIVALAETVRGELDAKKLALLGLLSACAALMRLPISFAGGNLIFFLPLVSGMVFGSTFGFMLGAIGMAASAFITGGIGPWLPFQVIACGWLGAGAGYLVRPIHRRFGTFWGVVGLAIYGSVGAFVYGGLMDLYFWPLVATGAPGATWAPGLGVRASVARFYRFYVLTSLPWDAMGALTNSVAILAMGRPVAKLMCRFRDRFHFDVDEDRAAESPVPVHREAPSLVG